MSEYLRQQLDTDAGGHVALSRAPSSRARDGVDAVEVTGYPDDSSYGRPRWFLSPTQARFLASMLTATADALERERTK